MLAQLQWPLLQQQKIFLKLIVFHKILHGSVSVLFTFVLFTTSTRGHSMRFVIPFARTDTYKHSFLPSIIQHGSVV